MKMTLTLLGLLLLAGCSTTEVRVITSNDFYYGCMNGVLVERALTGTLDPNNPRAKETNLQCLLVEQKYKEHIKQQQEPQLAKEPRFKEDL